MSLEYQFIDSLHKWTSGDLKDDLQKKGLSIKGQKAEMVLRLQDYYRQQMTESSTPSNTESSSPK